MATFEISLPGCVLCCDSGSQIEAGENLSLTIDGVKYPGLLTNPVSALVNSLVQAQVYNPDTNAMETGYVYNVTVDDSDMPVVGGSPLTELDITDLVGWECESCCVALEARIEVLEESIGAGTTYFISGPVVDDTDPVIAPAVAKEGDTVVQLNVTGEYEFWTYDGAAWNQEFKIPVATTTPRVLDGVVKPTTAPSTIDAAADDAKPVIYWDRFADLSYAWDVGSTSWVPIDRPKVLDGTVNPVGAPSTIDANASDSKPAVYWNRTTNALWGWNVSSVAWIQVTGPRQVIQGASDPTGNLPSFLDPSSLNTLPSVFHNRSSNELWVWNLGTLTWQKFTAPDSGALDIAPNGGDTNIQDITHTGSDGIADVTTNSGPGVGAVNSYATASVTGNTVGTYTVHELRGRNDGTAVDTATAGDARKVLNVETKAGTLRTSTIRVEDWVEATVFVDEVFGDNATGLRERRDMPFADYDAAHTAAADGDIIVVRGTAGVYTPPTPAQGIYAIGKSLTVDLTQCRQVSGTLLAEDGETLTVLGECDFHNFRADGGNIRGRIGRLLHPATFASTALDGGGFTPTVDLDIQSIEDGGGSAVNGYLFTSSDGAVTNLNVRGGIASSAAVFNITNTDSGTLVAKINGNVAGDDSSPLISIDSGADATVVAAITIDGDLTAGASGPIAAVASAGKMILNVGGTITANPADNAAGSTGVVMATDGGTVILRAARVRHDSDGASLATWDGGVLFADVAIYQIEDATGFLMGTAGAAGTNVLTIRGDSFVVYPGTAGNFHDNVANTGTVIRFQGEVFTTLTGAANTSLPWPVEGADDTGCTFVAGTYTDTQDLAGY